MSHSLSAPPPPPPTLPAVDNKNNNPAGAAHSPSISAAHHQQQLSDCKWALHYPEVQKACFLARVCEQTTPLRCQLRNVAAMLQEGPTCGLTALSMLLGGTPTPQQLLQSAKEQHYTNNGEMFSAQNLFQLICDHLRHLATDATNNENLSANAVINANTLAKECSNADAQIDQAKRAGAACGHCEMHEGRLDCAKVRAVLLAGACLFVPYDPDYNHTPCLKHGHKAHWALIIGYLISDRNEFYVLARHGKTKNLAVWSLKALSDSNANIFEFAQPKGYPDCDFLLPPGGIGGDLGLRERAIIVNELPHQTIKIR